MSFDAHDHNTVAHQIPIDHNVVAYIGSMVGTILCVLPGQKLAVVRRWANPSMSQEAFAERLSMHRTTLAKYEAQGYVPPKTLEKIAKLVKVPLSWFLDESATERPPVQPFTGSPLDPPSDVVGNAPGNAPPNPIGAQEPVHSAGRRSFPILGKVGAAVFPISNWSPDAAGADDDYVEFSDDLFQINRFAIVVKGDSQEPLLRNGDVVLVHPDPDAPLGLFGVFADENQRAVVKIRRRDAEGDERLYSVNGDYPPMKIPEGWECIGYLVALRRNRGRGKYWELGDNDGLSPRTFED